MTLCANDGEHSMSNIILCKYRAKPKILGRCNDYPFMGVHSR